MIIIIIIDCQVSDFAAQSAKDRAKAQARGGKPPPVKEGPDIMVLLLSTQKSNIPSIYSAAPCKILLKISITFTFIYSCVCFHSINFKLQYIYIIQ